MGLALQGSLSNLAAGVLLVMFRPFRAGEYVDLGGIAGTVQNVQIFLHYSAYRRWQKSWWCRTAKIIAGNIINFSREPARRNEFIIGVSYDADIDKVKQLLTAIIESDDRILRDREMTVRLNELGASSVNFVVRVWSKKQRPAKTSTGTCWSALSVISTPMASASRIRRWTYIW